VTAAITAEAQIDSEALQAFAMQIRGAVLRAGDPGYDDARRIWNGLIDRHPALIVQCTGAADVVDAVNFAREHGLLLSIKAGGHNVAGNAVNDGGLVIDLSQMRGVHVDSATQTVRVQGGRRWATWIGRRSSSGWPFPQASSRRPASRV
jgi:FAD/FMN-containing dehydrogenase